MAYQGGGPSGRMYGRRWLLRRSAVGGVGLAGAFLLACGGGNSGTSTSGTGGSTAPAASTAVAAQQTQEAPVSGGRLNTVIKATAPLDPHTVSAAPQRQVAGVYSRLFRFQTGPDPKLITDHIVENDLALSMESPDAVTWTVKMRPDAKFQNISPVSGHAVEAEDIKATFVRALNEPRNPNRGALSMMDPNGITTPDKNTVIFKLNYPYAQFRQTLASPGYGLILPREALAGTYDPGKVVIGSGPFIMDMAQYNPDSVAIYKKNPDWFEKGRPYIDETRTAVIPADVQQLAQFTAGNLDEIIIAFNDLETARRDNPKAVYIESPAANPYPLYLQMGQPGPMQDIRMRRALSLAMDREAMGKAIYNNKYEKVVIIPAYQGKQSLKVDELPADLKQWYAYNPAESKKLLEAAGQANTTFKFIYIQGSPTGFGEIYKAHAEMAANMLNQVGIKTQLIQHDYNKDFIAGGKGSRQGNFAPDEMVFGAIGNFTDADEFLYSYFHSKSLSNQEKLNDPQFDAMVDKSRTIVNDAERLKASRDIQQYLAEKMYAPSTAGPYDFRLVQPWVRDYNFSNSLGVYTETYAKLWLKK